MSKKKKRKRSGTPQAWPLYRLPGDTRYEAKLLEDGVTMRFRDLFNPHHLNQIPSGPIYHNIADGIVLEVQKSSVVVESWTSCKQTGRKQVYVGRRPRGWKWVRVKVGPLVRLRKLTFATSIIEIRKPGDKLEQVMRTRRPMPMVVEVRPGE